MIEETRLGQIRKRREKDYGSFKINLILTCILMIALLASFYLKSPELLVLSGFSSIMLCILSLIDLIDVRYYDTKYYMFKYFRKKGD